jgi:predicted DNA-binding protein (MmcQ/YjbR family)
VTRPAAFAKAELALRDYALSFPETHEDFPWGHRALKVRGKGFLFMGGDEKVFSLSVKLPTSRDGVLLLPFASPTAYGLGKSGWVTAQFTRKDKIPLDWIRSWIEESYCAVAPKKLATRLRDGAAEPIAAKPEKKSTRKRTRST